MRVWLVVLATALVAAVGLIAASPAGASPVAQAAPAAHCFAGGGYVHADFSWGDRCIRAGQFCKKVRNPEYHKYSFQCVNGKLRKQTGKRKGN